MKTFQVLRDLRALVVTAILRWLSKPVRRPTALAALALAAFVAWPVQAVFANVAVVYVNIAGTPTTEDGTNWSNAYRFLQDGLSGAQAILDDPQAPPDLTVEIWVAEGTYRPDQSNSVDPQTANPYCAPYGDCDKFTSFNIPSNVSLLGGFSGSESNPGQRPADTSLYPTILSGDLEADDSVTIYDGNGDLVLNMQNYGDNSYVIVKIEGGSPVTLDRMTIKGGRLGMEITSDAGAADVLVEDCIIERNGPAITPATDRGGILIEFSSIELRRSILRHNRTFGLSFGGAAIFGNGADILVIDSDLVENRSQGPGTIYCHRCGYLTAVNSTLQRNRTRYSGGMFVSGGAENSAVRVWNCLVSDNVAESAANEGGGAIDVVGTGTAQDFSVHIINCTIANNPFTGTGSLATGVTLKDVLEAEISNSIVWGNSAVDDAQIEAEFSNLTINSSDIESCCHVAECGSFDETICVTVNGNIYDDPQFLDGSNGDYRLDPEANSPCIDTGDSCLLPLDCFDLDPEIDGWNGSECASAPACPPGSSPNGDDRHPIDLDGRARVFGASCPVDMGAYEYISPPSDCQAADLDDSGIVGVPDLLLLLDAWGACSDCQNCPEDLDGNCAVGVPDLILLLTEWGIPCGTDSVCMSNLIQDCMNRFATSSQDFLDCVDWVEEHRTIYPEQE